jgi:hypothetical protein
MSVAAKRMAEGGHRESNSPQFLPKLIFWQLSLASVVVFLWVVFLVTGDPKIDTVAGVVLALVVLLGGTMLGKWIPEYRRSRASVGADDDQLAHGPPSRVLTTCVVAVAQGVLVVAMLILVLATSVR